MILRAWNRIPVVVKIPVLLLLLSVLDFAISAFKDVAVLPHYELMFRAALWLLLGAALLLEVIYRIRSRLLQLVVASAFIAYAYYRFVAV